MKKTIFTIFTAITLFAGTNSLIKDKNGIIDVGKTEPIDKTSVVIRKDWEEIEPLVTQIDALIKNKHRIEKVSACIKDKNGFETCPELAENCGEILEYTQGTSVKHTKTETLSYTDVLECIDDSSSYNKTTKACEVSKDLDLSKWGIKEIKGGITPSKWIFSSDGTIGTQLTNTTFPTILLYPKPFEKKWTLSGNIKVNIKHDDDFIGLVFGYKNPSDYYIFDWKKSSQEFGPSKRGLRLIHVTKNSQKEDFYWTYYSTQGLDILTSDFNYHGWESNTNYKIKLKANANKIEAYINDQKVLEYTSPTLDISGYLGFYGLSQDHVEYSSFSVSSDPHCPEDKKEFDPVNNICYDKKDGFNIDTVKKTISHSWYEYKCPSDTDEYGQKWRVLNSGGDCSHPKNGVCNSSTPPKNNCVRGKPICPSDPSNHCVEVGANPDSMKDNYDEENELKFEYFKGFSIEHMVNLEKTPECKNDDILTNGRCSVMNPDYQCVEKEFVYDKNKQQCIKEPSCKNGILDKNGNCIKEASVKCEEGYLYNKYSKKCEKTPTCINGFIFDKDLKRCKAIVKSSACPNGYTFNENKIKCEKPLAYTDKLECIDPSSDYNKQTKLCQANKNLNLSTWGTIEHSGGDTPSSWEYSADGSTGTQLKNTTFPTLLLFPKPFEQNWELSGKIKVNTNHDDDFIGLAFGYKNSSDYYVFDWKQADQERHKKSLHYPKEGVRLVHFTKNSNEEGFYWSSKSLPGAEILKSNFNFKGWSDFTEYNIKIKSRDGKIKAFINDQLVLEYEDPDADFSGRLGFYGLSQDHVKYSNFFVTSDPHCPAGKETFDPLHNICYHKENNLNIDLDDKTLSVDPLCLNGIFNPKTHACENSSFCKKDRTDLSCKTGYIFNKQNGMCEKGDEFPATVTCPAEYKYSEKLKKCTKILTKKPILSCIQAGKGYSLNEESKCEKETIKDYKPICKDKAYKYNPITNLCEKTLTLPVIPKCDTTNGYSYNAGTKQCEKLYKKPYVPKCKAGHFLTSKNKCEIVTLTDIIKKCNEGILETNTGLCKIPKEKPFLKKCLEGDFDPEKDICKVERTEPFIPKCTQGVLNSDKTGCLVDEYKSYSKYCPNGILNSNATACKVKQTKPFNKQCIEGSLNIAKTACDVKISKSINKQCTQGTLNLSKTACDVEEEKDYKKQCVEGYLNATKTACDVEIEKPFTKQCTEGYLNTAKTACDVEISKPIIKYCEKGFLNTNNKCQYTDITNPSVNTCPSGYTDTGSDCKKIIERDFKYSCKPGESLIGTSQGEKCVTLKSPSKEICPNGYLLEDSHCWKIIKKTKSEPAKRNYNGYESQPYKSFYFSRYTHNGNTISLFKYTNSQQPYIFLYDFVKIASRIGHYWYGNSYIELYENKNDRLELNSGRHQAYLYKRIFYYYCPMNRPDERLEGDKCLYTETYTDYHYIAPTLKCQDGENETIENGEKKCYSSTSEAKKCAYSDYSFTEKSGKCITTLTKPYSKKCKTGYTEINGKCKKTATTSYIPKCDPNYHLSGNQCLTTIQKPYAKQCETGYRLDGNICKKTIQKPFTPVCEAGWLLSNGKCHRTIQKPFSSSCDTGWQLRNNKCYKTIQKPYKKTCNAGWTFSGNSCYKYIEEPYQKICKQGWQLKNDKCHRIVTKPYQKFCKKAFSLGNDNKCHKIELKPYEPYCDDGYTLYGGKCHKTIIKPALNTCPSSLYTIVNGKCERRIYTTLKESEKSCPDQGYSYMRQLDQCGKWDYKAFTPICPQEQINYRGFSLSKDKKQCEKLITQPFIKQCETNLGFFLDKLENKDICRKIEFKNPIPICTDGYISDKGICKKTYKKTPSYKCDKKDYKLDASSKICAKKDYIFADSSLIDINDWQCKTKGTYSCENNATLTDDHMCEKKFNCNNGHFITGINKEKICVGDKIVDCEDWQERTTDGTKCLYTPLCLDPYLYKGDTCVLKYKWYEYTCPSNMIGPDVPGKDCKGNCGKYGCSCNEKNPLPNNCRKVFNYDHTKVNILKKDLDDHKIELINKLL